MIDKMECDCSVIHEEVVDNVKSLSPDDEEFEMIANFYKVMADKTRIKILWLLDESEMCVCDIANICNMTKSAISHQLALLRTENFVKNRKEGKEVFYSLKDNHVKFMLENTMKHIKE